MSQALSVVKVGVDATGAIGPLNRTTAAANKLSVAAKGTTASMAGASTAAKGMGASMIAAMGPFIAITGAVTLLGKSLSVFGQRESDVAALSKGLSRLSGGVKALNDLNKAADRLGNQTLFSEDDFRQGFVLLTSFKAIGVDSYERVAKAAADIAHANKVDVKTSFMQLAKALQDPERNLAALNRSGIAFTKTQTDMIKALMASGKEAEAHAMILKIVEGSYEDLAITAGQGFKGKLDKLTESFDDFAQKIGSALVPALEPLVDGLARLLEAFSKVPSEIYSVIAIMIGAGGLLFAIGKIIKAVQLLNLTLSFNPWYLLAAGVAAATVAIYRAATANDRFANEILNGTRPIGEAVTKIGELEKAVEDYRHNLAQSELPFDERTFRLNPLLGKFENIEALKQELNRLKDVVTVVKEQGSLFGETNLDPITQSAQNLNRVFDQIALTIRDGLTEAIMGAIEGTKTLGEVASSVFRQIGRALIQYGISAGLSGMFPWMAPALGFGKRAAGGPVGKDKPYLVGERGPEMFVPNSAGRVVPNNQVGGGATSIVVNVDASGSSAEGDDSQAAALGNMLGQAIQAELVRQKRPGGLLAA